MGVTGVRLGKGVGVFVGMMICVGVLVGVTGVGDLLGVTGVAVLLGVTGVLVGGIGVLLAVFVGVIGVLVGVMEAVSVIVGISVLEGVSVMVGVNVEKDVGLILSEQPLENVKVRPNAVGGTVPGQLASTFTKSNCNHPLELAGKARLPAHVVGEPVSSVPPPLGRVLLLYRILFSVWPGLARSYTPQSKVRLAKSVS
jgi:hypothetical protein